MQQFPNFFYIMCDTTLTLQCVLCGPDLEVCRVSSKHVTVKRFAHFIYWWFPPASSVITKCTVLRPRRRWQKEAVKKLAKSNTLIGHLTTFSKNPFAVKVVLPLGWGSSVQGSWDWGRREGGRTSAWLSAREGEPCGHSGKEQIDSMSSIKGVKQQYS